MKKIKLYFEKADGSGIGYEISPATRTYATANLLDGTLDSSTKENKEYVDNLRFANQLYYVILASLKE